MVGPVGLEPTRLSTIVPKTILATSYSTVPNLTCKPQVHKDVV